LAGLNLTGTAMAGGAAGRAFAWGWKPRAGAGFMLKLAAAAAAAALAASMISVTPSKLSDGPVDKDMCSTSACLMAGSQVMAGLGGNASRKLRQECAEAMLG